MAQVLKDDVRESILSAAREEFLSHGIADSSMRRIASNSRMTVGNLYRYFKSKDDLSETIVSPTYMAINSMVVKLTEGRLDMSKEGGELNATIPELKEMLSSLSDGLVDIYREHRTEVRILMMSSRLNTELTNWFEAAVAELISKYYEFSKEDERVQIMAKCYADSIFSGIRTILSNPQLSDDTLKNMVKIYLNSFLLMLDRKSLGSM